MHRRRRRLKGIPEKLWFLGVGKALGSPWFVFQIIRTRHSHTVRWPAVSESASLRLESRSLLGEEAGGT